MRGTRKGRRVITWTLFQREITVIRILILIFYSVRTSNRQGQDFLKELVILQVTKVSRRTLRQGVVG